MKQIVPYFRVSTRKQGDSGLGLDAQRTTVARFAADGCQIVAEFIEIETGKSANRPELLKAIALCKATGATLVVAKLDRLARNVHFTSSLMEAGVDFVACDMPYANRLTIHIMAAMAEDEARRISQRTRDALAELKAKGVALGSARPGHWDGREHKRGWNGMDPIKRQELKTQRLNETYRDVLPLILTLRERGEDTKSIAEVLRRRGFKTRRGCDYSASTVYNILSRCEIVQAVA